MAWQQPASDRGREQSKKWPEEFGGAERLAAWRLWKRPDRNHGKSGLECLRKKLAYQIGFKGGPRTEPTRSTRSIDVASARRRAASSSPRISGEQGLCAADRIGNHDASGVGRRSPCISDLARGASAARTRRGASLEIFTNTVPLRPARGNTSEMQPRTWPVTIATTVPNELFSSTRCATRNNLSGKRHRASTGRSEKIEN